MATFGPPKPNPIAIATRLATINHLHNSLSQFINMPNSKIDIIGPGELSLIVDMYNQIFQPTHEPAFFERRLQGRHNQLRLVASIDDNPVGFFIGYELKPNVYYEWLYGILPDMRRASIGSQLVDAANAWATEHDYEYTRMECHNQHRPMLHMAIARGYDIQGMRYEPDRHANLVIFEKPLHRDQD